MTLHRPANDDQADKLTRMLAAIDKGTRALPVQRRAGGDPDSATLMSEVIDQSGSGTGQ